MRKTIDAMISYILGMVIIAFASPVLTNWLGVYSSVLLEILILVVPMLIVLFKHENFKERFLIKLPSIRDFGGALLVFIGTGAISSEASLILSHFTDMTNTTDEVFFNNYISSLSPFMALIIVALVPAICEEMLYRGYILSSFKVGEKSFILPIIASSVLFSAAHLDSFKAVPVLITGIGFAIIAFFSDSILLTVLGHFYNNAMIVISFYQIKKQTGDSGGVSIVLGDKATVCISVVGILLGVLLVVLGICVFKKKKPKGCLVGIITVLFIVVSAVLMFVAARSEIGEPYGEFVSESVAKNSTETAEFTLNKNTICIPMIEVHCEDENTICKITIKSEDGREIITAENYATGGYHMLEKGKYTVSYTYEGKDSTPERQEIYRDCHIITFAEYVTEKTK